MVGALMCFCSVFVFCQLNGGHFEEKGRKGIELSVGKGGRG